VSLPVVPLIAIVVSRFGVLKLPIGQFTRNNLREQGYSRKNSPFHRETIGLFQFFDIRTANP
jgi:hypothetical protein